MNSEKSSTVRVSLPKIIDILDSFTLLFLLKFFFFFSYVSVIHCMGLFFFSHSLILSYSVTSLFILFMESLFLIILFLI